jgi:hypothetical protein
MTLSLSNFEPIVRHNLSERATEDIFLCLEESQFYSQCLDSMALSICEDSTILEFGSGEGSPVINSLLKNKFNGLVKGYELSSKACEVAQSRINYYCLNHKYVVNNSSFFDQSSPSKETFLIANPPYLPAIDNNLYMPTLHGGADGSSITKQLLAQGFERAMLMISAYSDPIGTIEYANKQGYQVDNFVASPMSFGYYSSEPKVSQRMADLRTHGQAFYSQNIYLLAGVLFKKRHELKPDLSQELIKSLTAL